MTEQERALRRLAAFLDRQQVPYVVIGGLAVAVWGDPRATLDIATSIWVPEDSVESFVLEAGNDFELLVELDSLGDDPLPSVVPQALHHEVKKLAELV